MPKAIPLRNDYSAHELRALARGAHDANQARRLLALAGIRDGLSRTEAGRLGAMDAQTLRYWVSVFNADGPDGLINTPPPGRPPKLSPEQKREVARWVDAGPDPEHDGVVRWRRVDLKQVIRDRYGIDLDETTVGRLLKELGFTHVSARARHPRQAPEAIDVFKHQTLPEQVAGIAHTVAPGTPIEWWFQDEMRVGQKNSTVYQWARRGTRPRQPADQRYESAYLFGALCPARDTGAALVLPVVNTQAMQYHLAEISATVARDAHAIVLMDQAGWHTTAQLEIPSNLSIVYIPPATPELNPAENVWQYLRQTYLGNRVFQDYDDIIACVCQAWRALLAETGRIQSITHRDWACLDHYL